MKVVIVLSCLVAAALCVPNPARLLPAVSHEEVHDEHGQFHLRYVTGEGAIVEQHGKLVPTTSGDYVLMITGEYSYLGEDGKRYSTKYTSGTDGFKAQGEHLPKEPIV